MKITTRVVWDWDGNVIDEQAEEYSGPVTELKGSTSYGNTTGKTDSAPWTPQQPYLGEVFKLAQNQFYNGQPRYFSGSTVSPFSSQTEQGLNMMEGAASNPILPGLSVNALAPVLNGEYLGNISDWRGQLTNPNAGVMAGTAKNDYLGQDPNAYINDLTNSISRSVIPGVQGSFAASGRTGSSPIAQQTMAKGIADALAPFAFGSAEAAQNRLFQGGESQASREQGTMNDWAARMFGAGESASDRALSAYGNERDRMMSGIGMAPGIDASRYYGADQMLQAGGMRDALSQAQLSDQVARWDFEQNAPTTALENYASLISGGYGGTTNSSGVSPMGQSYPGMNIFGGGMRMLGK